MDKNEYDIFFTGQHEDLLKDINFDFINKIESKNNRLDDIIVFDKLQKEEIKEIVKIQVNKLKNILKDKNLTFTITDNALEWLVDKGFDQEYGARPLKRAIQKYIQNPIANLILDMKDKKLDAIKIDVDGDQLILNNKVFAIN